MISLESRIDPYLYIDHPSLFGHLTTPFYVGSISNNFVPKRKVKTLAMMIFFRAISLANDGRRVVPGVNSVQVFLIGSMLKNN